MDKVFEIKSKYGNESESSKYDRFSEEHMRKLIKNVDADIADDILRMARAFPTFKLFFVEEGRAILFDDDDTYGYGSVEDIAIHKSRDNAADTAVISMTNFLGHLDNYAFESGKHADSTDDYSEDFARKSQEAFEDMKLRPGTRIQLKMGYTSFNNDLENVFTGKITEITYGDKVVITAQGYGVELLNPLGYNYWGKKERFLWSNPRRLIISMLKTISTRHLGWRKIANPDRRAHRDNWLRFDNDIDDNVYLETGNWWASANKWCTDFSIYHENAWDVIQDLCRRFPGYIAAVVPFDKRGTFFFGLPDSLYFYTVTPDEVTREIYIETIEANGGLHKGEVDLNQKLFRSYHLKTSESHIISNNVKIDLSNFYNRVIVRYDRSIYNNKKNKNKSIESHKIVMADDTIEKEYWRTKIVKEDNCENSDQAYLYGLGNLIECTKTLYDGELVVLGDPKIKPHDVVMIHDNYTGMYGPVGVREVVHNFSREEGFTTTIVPDLMIHINVPLHHLTTMLGAFNASILGALLSAPLLKGGFKKVFEVVSARLGWKSEARQPIGITPLVYNNRPYIAGFEGMKYNSLFVRKLEGFKRKWSDLGRGIEEVGDIFQNIIRRIRF